MTQFTLPYGKTTLTFELPDTLDITVLAPAETPAAGDPLAEVNRALDDPVGLNGLGDFQEIKTAAIAVNDKTRPVPHHHLLPPLLERLEALGLPPEAITLVIATGTHPPMPPNEFEWVLPPEILARYPVVCHDANQKEEQVYLGQTQRGTPIWLNRTFAQADLRVVIGNIEPHQFMGFSGGVKSAVIGLGGHETINHNHAMMSNPESRLGRFDTNPTRQDVEEMGRLAGIHFALNAILNQHKKIVSVIAGDPADVMRQGIPQVKKLYQIDVPVPFDLMIVSPGGYPKDINLYQSQKGLAHAALVTKDGGTIFLAAACPEGSGSDKYEKWMQGKTSYQAIFEQFEEEGFRIGPHKAFQIARDAARTRVLLRSEMPPDFVEYLLLTPVYNFDKALAQALDTLPAQARIGIMPLANATIPALTNK